MATKYETVKEKIRDFISSGKYQPGDQLPTESALMAKYGVGRYTIRRAMGELESEHYIYRIQGGGCLSKTVRLTMTNQSTKK